jgi:hypothetical protein
MIEATISSAIILLINVVVWVLLRVIPLSITLTLATKIKAKWLVNVSEIVEGLAIPFLFYGVSQFMYVVMVLQLYWVYCLAIVICILLTIFPLLVLVYASKLKKRLDAMTREIL